MPALTPIPDLPILRALVDLKSALVSGRGLQSVAREAIHSLAALDYETASSAMVRVSVSEMATGLEALRSGHPLPDEMREPFAASLDRLHTYMKRLTTPTDFYVPPVTLPDEKEQARRVALVLTGPAGLNWSSDLCDKWGLPRPTPPPQPTPSHQRVADEIMALWEAIQSAPTMSDEEHRARVVGPIETWIERAAVDPHYRTAQVLDTLFIIPWREVGPRVGTVDWFQYRKMEDWKGLLVHLHTLLGCDRGPFSEIVQLNVEQTVCLYRVVRRALRSDDSYFSFRNRLVLARSTRQLVEVIHFFDQYNSLSDAEQRRFVRGRLGIPCRLVHSFYRLSEFRRAELRSILWNSLNSHGDSLGDRLGDNLETEIERFRRANSPLNIRLRVRRLSRRSDAPAIVRLAVPHLQAALADLGWNNSVPDWIQEMVLVLEIVAADTGPPYQIPPAEQRDENLISEIAMLVGQEDENRRPEDRSYWDGSKSSRGTSDLYTDLERGAKFARYLWEDTPEPFRLIVYERVRLELEIGDTSWQLQYAYAVQTERLAAESPLIPDGMRYFDEMRRLVTRGENPHPLVRFHLLRTALQLAGRLPPAERDTFLAGLGEELQTFQKILSIVRNTAHSPRKEAEDEIVAAFDLAIDLMPSAGKGLAVRAALESMRLHGDRTKNKEDKVVQSLKTHGAEHPEILIRILETEPSLQTAITILVDLFKEDLGLQSWPPEIRLRALQALLDCCTLTTGEEDEKDLEVFAEMLSFSTSPERVTLLGEMKREVEESPDKEPRYCLVASEVSPDIPEWQTADLLPLWKRHLGDDRTAHLTRLTADLPPRQFPTLFKTLYEITNHANRDIATLVVHLIDRSRTPGEFQQVVPFFGDLIALTSTLRYGFLREIQETLRIDAAGKRQGEPAIRLAPTKARERLRSFLIRRFVDNLRLPQKEREVLLADLQGRITLWQAGRLLPHLASLASFSETDGLEAIAGLAGDLIKEEAVIATAAAGNRRFVNPGRYDGMKGDFPPDFIKRWANGDGDFLIPLGELDPEGALKDPMAFRRSQYDFFATQLAHHLGVPEASNLPRPELMARLKSLFEKLPLDQIRGGKEWTIQMGGLIDKLSDLQEIQETEVVAILDRLNNNPAIFERLGDQNHEIIVDIGAFKRSLNARPLTGKAWLIISSDPADFIGSGRNPVNCQDPTRNTGYNKNGEQVTRARQGRFRYAKVILADRVRLEKGLAVAIPDGKVVAWSELEVTPEKRPSGPTPHLLAEVIYGTPGFTFQDETAEGLNRFASECLRMNPEREVHIQFTGQGMDRYPSPLPDDEGDVYRDTFHASNLDDED